MKQYIIKGGRPLQGEVQIGGAKNAALGILAAAIMTDETVVIDNLPDVQDINVLLEAIAGIGANDWEDRVTAEMRAKMILKQAKDGDIILLHDAEGNSMTVEALDTIIPELQKQGYKFVTVTELFKIKGIEPDMEKVYTNVLQKNMYN